MQNTPKRILMVLPAIPMSLRIVPKQGVIVDTILKLKKHYYCCGMIFFQTGRPTAPDKD